MNQEKIGKFIAKCRKEKKLTQVELAEKLGVTEKSISNWENGRNMPDLSLFKPLCDELGISINELLSGEKIKEKVYLERFEENIINTIDYSNKKVNEKNNLIGIILIVFGVMISFTVMTIFSSDSSWGSIYSVFGGIISLIGISKFTKRLSYGKRLLFNFGYFILFICMLFLIDYISVVNLHQSPRFSYSKTTYDNMIIYEAPFYNVYRVNVDMDNEYYIIDTKKEYTKDSVPITMFDRDKSGIDNIIKYKSNSITDNTNINNLVSSLPLSEYEHEVKIDEEKLGLEIIYSLNDWYVNNNYYLEKSLIYNSVSIFILIDNVEYITFNFNDVNYTMTRYIIEKIYPNYNEIIRRNIDKRAFDRYLENQLNDNDFVINFFKDLFIDEQIILTKKIVVKNNNDEIMKTIINENEIGDIVDLMLRSTRITGVINDDGNWWNIYMYDENDKVINKFLVWGFNGYSSCFGFDSKEYMMIGLDGEKFSEIIKK